MPETLPPQQTSFFPIGTGIIDSKVEVYSMFSPVELDAIYTGNMATLPSDSPDRYLLEGSARTNVPSDARQAAYRAGVCVGLSMVRKRQAELERTGSTLPAASFEPSQGPDFAIPRTKPVPRYMPKSFREGVTYINALSEIIERPAHYMAGEDSIESVGRLKANWLLQGNHVFFTLAGIEGGHDDYISTGLGDTFELYARLYTPQRSRPSLLSRLLKGSIIRQ